MRQSACFLGTEGAGVFKTAMLMSQTSRAASRKLENAIALSGPVDQGPIVKRHLALPPSSQKGERDVETGYGHRVHLDDVIRVGG